MGHFLRKDVESSSLKLELYVCVPYTRYTGIICIVVEMCTLDEFYNY